MRKIVFILAIMLLVAFNSNAQEVGKIAPDIKISKWLTKEPKLKGKKVFLEFWATWCGPCKKMIPHINELVDKYGKDIEFVSITAETEDKIKDFMKKTMMKAKIGLDDNDKTMKAYDIKYIPHAFLIADNGKVAWAGNPAELTDKMIESFVSGASIGDEKVDDPTENLIYALNIAKTMTPNEPGSYAFRPGQIQIQNLTLSGIVELITEHSPNRIKISDKINLGNLDLYYCSGTTNNFDQYKNDLMNDISRALKLNVKAKKENVQYYKIQCNDCSKLEKDYQETLKKVKRLETTIDEADNKWIAKSASVSLLIKFLETKYNLYFEDNTNLKGFYDFSVSTKSKEDALKDLEKLGFKTSLENGAVDILEVNPMDSK
jgi:thiol-disulfide isomerase/thioredoxin